MINLIKVENEKEIVIGCFNNVLEAIDVIATTNKFSDVIRFKITDNNDRVIFGVRLFLDEVIWRVPRKKNPRGRDIPFWKRWFTTV